MEDLVMKLIEIATPVIVGLVIKLWTLYGPKVPGWVTVFIMVPVVSGLTTLITNLLGTPDLAWYMQAIYGLVAVFIREVGHQIGQGNTGGTLPS